MSILRLMGLAGALTAGVTAAWGQVPALEAAAPAVAPAAAAGEEDAAPGPAWKFFVHERLRAESWDWFTPSAGRNDTIFGHSLLVAGLSYRGEQGDIFVEVAQATLVGLPTGAVGPGSQGPLGLGANYLAANNGATDPANVFVKQAYLSLRPLARVRLQLGRLGFNDGAELQPANAKLKQLVNTRLSQRLIGEFGFSAVERSFDGAEVNVTAAGGLFTGFAARPTEGVFQVDGMGELPINVFYGSYARELPAGASDGEVRVFAAGYQDWRTGVVKVDNRAAAARSADTQAVRIGTYGADYAEVFPLAGVGQGDVLAWGAWQSGRWGGETQRAGAFLTEAGIGPSGVPLAPWLSAGMAAGSGDGNPNDGVHGTFMQMLPTPRLAARFPFYDMENNQDFYAALDLHAAPAVVRSELHGLRLSNGNDLWYQGGGAFQDSTFGFSGRPSNGARSLASVADLSVDFPLTGHATVTAYYAHAWGRRVVALIYPRGAQANFVYMETDLDF